MQAFLGPELHETELSVALSHERADTLSCLNRKNALFLLAMNMSFKASDVPSRDPRGWIQVQSPSSPGGFRLLHVSSKGNCNNRNGSVNGTGS